LGTDLIAATVACCLSAPAPRGSAAGAPERHRREFRRQRGARPQSAAGGTPAEQSDHRLPLVAGAAVDGRLEPEGAPSYEKGAGDAGAGGIEIWRFAPTQAGEGTLRLEYRRLWEADAAPARVVSYKVTVRE